jgi:signal recognition particle subunit SEC65
MQGQTMLRVANVGDEPAMESIRDALDRLGVDYEHVYSEPNENYYPQTAYFYVPDDFTDDVDHAMQEQIGRAHV